MKKLLRFYNLVIFMKTAHLQLSWNDARTAEKLGLVMLTPPLKKCRSFRITRSVYALVKVDSVHK